MRPVPHLERIIHKGRHPPPDSPYQSSTPERGPKRIDTWTLVGCHPADSPCSAAPLGRRCLSRGLVILSEVRRFLLSVFALSANAPAHAVEGPLFDFRPAPSCHPEPRVLRFECSAGAFSPALCHPACADAGREPGWVSGRCEGSAFPCQLPDRRQLGNYPETELLEAWGWVLSGGAKIGPIISGDEAARGGLDAIPLALARLTRIYPS